MVINQEALDGIYTGFKTIFQGALEKADPLWPLIAMEAPSGGEQEDHKWLGDMPKMREWLGNRVIKDLSGFHYVIVNKNWESTISVDRNHIEDDRLGIYRPKIQSLAQEAIDHRDELAFSLLNDAFTEVCFDNQYMVDDDHPVGSSTVSNYGGGSGAAWFLADLSRPIKPIIMQLRRAPEFVAMDQPTAERAFMRREYLYGVDDRKNVGFGLWQTLYGSKRAIDTTYYPAARAAMMAFTNDELSPLKIRPTHLIVGPSNEAAGKAMVEAQFNSAGASNVWYNSAKLVVVPWLT